MFIGNTFVGHKLNGKRVEKRERQGDEIDFDWDPHSLSQRYVHRICRNPNYDDRWPAWIAAKYLRSRL